MIELSIVLSVAIVAYTARIYLHQRQQEIDFKHRINNESTTVEQSKAYDEQFRLYNERINSTWNAISTYKEELNALKLSIAIKGK